MIPAWLAAALILIGIVAGELHGRLHAAARRERGDGFADVVAAGIAGDRDREEGGAL